MFSLRPYQQTAVNAGVAFLKDKRKEHGIIVIPTGGGKSIVIAEIIQQLEGHVIIFQPSKELLEQNLAKYNSYGYNADVYSASANQKTIGKVTFATIGSCYKTPEIFSHFDYIIVDECHLVKPDEDSMYSKFLASVPTKILGLTATPVRLKRYNFPAPHAKLCMLNRTKPKVFSEFIHVTQISEIIENGFWSPIEYFKLEYDVSYLKVNSSGSDYTDESLVFCNKQNDVQGKIINYVERLIKVGRKHILIFVPTIAEAEELSQRFPLVDFIHSELNKKDRAEKLDRFKSGTIKAIVNVGVLAIGFDFPALDTIIGARKTMSLAAYYQMLGRGVRLHPSKKSVYYIDLVGNTDAFGKIETLAIEKRKTGWGIFSGNRQITNMPLDAKLNDSIVHPNTQLSLPLDKKESKGDKGIPTMPFGTHKGLKLNKVPEHYLVWFFKNIKPNTEYVCGVLDWISVNIMSKK